MVSLENTAYDMSEAYAHYGIAVNITELNLIISTLITTVLMIYLLSNARARAYLQSTFTYEVIILLIILAWISMLVARDLYLLLFLSLLSGWSFYHFLTHSYYKKESKKFMDFLDDYF